MVGATTHRVTDRSALAIRSVPLHHGDTFRSETPPVPLFDAFGFVLSCQYAHRSISPEDHGALIDDPDWRVKPLI